MPVEIKELIIKTTITEDQELESSGSDATDARYPDREAIISACVEQVLTIIERRKER